MEKLQPTTARPRGYSWWTAILFVMGDVVGSGVLSVPGAIAKTGWSGYIILAYCGLCTCISGLCLSKSWMILEERFPEYKNGLTRKPMATIGYHAFGKPMSTLLSATMYLGKIGGTAIYLFVAGSMLQSILEPLVNLPLCSWNPIVAALLLAPLWLNSLADFWIISYTAVISAVLATALIITDVSVSIASGGISDDFGVESLESYASAYGTLLFAFGGAGVFPNIQNDMRKRADFSKAVSVGMLGLFLLYLPSSSLSYLAFGSATSSNIVNDLNLKSLNLAIEICLLVHCFSVIFLNINPVFLDVEEVLKVPKTFNYKRCLVRAAILSIALLFAETVPSFSSIQALIGGTAFSIMLTLPPINYVKLVYGKSEESINMKKWPERSIPHYQLVLIAIVVCSGVVGGLMATVINVTNFAYEDSVCFGRH